ncbi:MAG: GNAT family N-acetyltransferase [Jiangellaceae bacterium]
MSGDGVHVGRLHPSRAPDAGELIAAGHGEYPGFRHVFPDPAVRRRVLRPLMVATARDAAVHGHALAADDGGGLLGVALWMPPGTFPMSRARVARMAALVRMAWDGRGAVGRFMRVGAALAEAHPAHDCWYLQTMSVHPRAQRRRVGTGLMAPALAITDEAGLPCYLQTSDSANVDYYRRFGFEVSQPVIATYAGGPAYLGMARPVPCR